MDKELINFVAWLPENSDLFEGMTIEETVSKINELSTSDEGKQTLEQLTKRYKGMELFKKGGKLHQLLCFKSGGKAPGCGCNKKIEKNQPGGSIASRIWNQMIGNDKYTDGDGATRQHASVGESAWRTAKRAADSPMIQAIPVVGDVADGVIAADYAAKGKYAPALSAVAAGLLMPDGLETVSHALDLNDYSRKVIQSRVEKEAAEKAAQKEIMDATRKARGGNSRKRAKDIFTEESLGKADPTIARGPASYWKNGETHWGNSGNGILYGQDRIDLQQKGGIVDAELPRYAKIVETRSPYAAERTIYYSGDKNNFGVEDGRIISIEEGIPIAIGHNKLVRNARQFGLNLPEINEFREPWYGQYREQPDGMDLNSISNIDQKKAAKETAEKINKIRNRK